MKLPRLAVASLLLLATSAAVSAPDTRQKVDLPPMMREHMMANMRDHLLAVTEIQEALAAGAFDRAADIAENRLGMSSLKSHGASHMAPHMPESMRDIGTGMHRAASQFAVAAQEAAVAGDIRRAVGGLAAVTRQCIACHAAYRVH